MRVPCGDLVLDCKYKGCSFDLYYSQGKPLYFISNMDGVLNEENKLAYRIYGLVLYGQVALKTKLKSKFIYERCSFNESKIIAIRNIINSDLEERYKFMKYLSDIRDSGSYTVNLEFISIISMYRAFRITEPFCEVIRQHNINISKRTMKGKL